MVSTVRAQMMTGDIGKGAATLRLVAAPAQKDGAFFAGVEILMTPGSHTYWKMPGEAGVPPVFSFDGSRNVKAATVLFPTPKRIVEEGLEAFGYGDRVVFPVAVTLADPGKPAMLHADVTYAVCNTICSPGHGTADLALPEGATAEGGGIVQSALALVPADMSPAQQAQLVVTPIPGPQKPSWTLHWTGPTVLEDIFANAPAGYFFTTRQTGVQSWTLTADEFVTAATAMPVPVELTLARHGGGLVTIDPLDVTPSTK